MSSDPNGVEGGVIYFSAVASTKGLGKSLNREVTGAANRAGQDAGEELVDGIEDAVEGAAPGIGDALGEGIAGSAESAGDGIGKKVAAAAGAAIAAAGIGEMLGGALSLASENANLDKQVDALSAPWAAPAQAADAARELFKQGWGESLEELGTLTTSVMSGIGEDSIGQITEISGKLMAISQSTGFEVGLMSQAIGSMLTTGLVESADDGANLIADVYQRFGAAAGEDLLDTITEYGVQFEKLGLTGADAFGLIDQMILGGARNTDVAADALKEFSILARENSESVRESYGLLGLDADKMIASFSAGGPEAKAAFGEVLTAMQELEDPIARNQASLGLFGTLSEDLGGALDNLTLDTTLFDDTGYAAELMVAAGDTLESTWLSLSRTLQLSLAEALEPLVPILKDVGGALVGFLGFLAENPAITTAILAIAAGIGLVAAAQLVWNAAALASPVTWILLAIVAAVALVVAAIVWVAQNWEMLGGIAQGVLSGITGFFDQIVAWFMNMPAHIEALGQAFLGFAGFLGQMLGQAGAIIMNLPALFELALSTIGAWFGSLGTQIGGFFAGIPGAAQVAGDAIVSWFTNAFTAIPGIVEGAWNAVADSIGRAIEWLKTTVNDLLGAFGGGFDTGFSGGKIPGLATGGTVTRGGTVLVGEAGPELLNLDAGASVIPLPYAAAAAGPGGGGRGGTIQIFNPIAEPASRTLEAKANRINAALAI